MALDGWLLDKSAAARADEPSTRRQLEELAGLLYLCPVGELEQLYSSRSARYYDELKVAIHQSFDVVGPPVDIFDRALVLQRDLAHHHGMWHRTPIPDLLITGSPLPVPTLTSIASRTSGRLSCAGWVAPRTGRRTDVTRRLVAE